MFVALFVLTYIATCIYCKKFGDWFSELSLDADLEYGSCKQSEIATAAEILVTNAVLAVFWFLGELYTKTFVYSIDDEIATGKQWQRDLDNASRARGIPPPVDLQALGQHSAHWNESLKQWKANGEKQKRDRESGKMARAVTFYAFFAGLALVDLLLIFAVSPSTYSTSTSVSRSASSPPP